jgi:Ni,Fe-hydrogenase III small subunit
MTKITKAALQEKLEAMPADKLLISLNDPAVDHKIKKQIERELDDRANRGTNRGFGEKR